MEALGGTGSHGCCEALNPAFLDASHCMGVVHRRGPSPPPADFPNGILHVFFTRRFRGAHAELFAVVHQRRRARGKQERSHQFCDLIVMHAVAVTVPLAGLIMIAEKIVRLPANGVPVNSFSNRRKSGAESLFTSAIWKSSATELRRSCTVHFGELGDIWLVGFADHQPDCQDTRSPLPHFAQNFVDFRQVVRVFVRDISVTVGILPWENRIIVEIGIFKQTRDRVDSKPGHAAFQPEAHSVIHGFAHLRIAPVQVGLLGIKMVVVILIGGGVKLPRRMAKPGLPVVWEAGPSRCRRAKYQIALRLLRDERRFLKPRMLVRVVMGNKSMITRMCASSPR